MNNSNSLKEASEVLINSTNFAELKQAIDRLHQLYSAGTGVTAGSINDEDIYLESGKAISPTKAAHCLLEVARTSTFVKGIYKAVLQLKERFPNQPIRILYAGTGPYSTLVLPLTAIFTAVDIRLYLLDVNIHSLNALKKLYAGLNLTEYAADFILADASTYKIPSGLEMHLIISETMQNGLKREPQVHIMNNLIPQLPDLGIFIPEEISVDAYLINMNEEQSSFYEACKKPERIHLSTIYRIGKNSQEVPQPAEVQIPQERKKLNTLSIFTHIKVYEQEVLSNYDCSLTLPIRIARLEENDYRQTVEFTYILNSLPYFQHRFIT